MQHYFLINTQLWNKTIYIISKVDMFVNVHGVTLQTASGISAHFLSLKSLCGEIKGY